MPTISIKTLSQESISVEATDTMIVGEILDNISSELGVDPTHTILVFCGRKLDVTLTLAQNGYDCKHHHSMVFRCVE
jgi:hypothetical protein